LTISIATFNNLLKKLVEVGVVEKRSIGYNRNEYIITN